MLYILETDLSQSFLLNIWFTLGVQVSMSGDRARETENSPWEAGSGGSTWVSIFFSLISPSNPTVRGITGILTRICSLLYNAAWLYLYSAGRKLLPGTFFWVFFFCLCTPLLLFKQNARQMLIFQPFQILEIMVH